MAAYHEQRVERKGCPILPPEQQRPSCTHQGTTDSATMDPPRTSSPSDYPRRHLLAVKFGQQWVDRGKQGCVVIEDEDCCRDDGSRILMAQRLMRPTMRLARWPRESSARCDGDRVALALACCFRPCRCIKPNAQASRDPLTIRACPVSKQHTAPATEHSTTCNLHWSQTAVH